MFDNKTFLLGDVTSPISEDNQQDSSVEGTTRLSDKVIQNKAGDNNTGSGGGSGGGGSGGGGNGESGADGSETEKPLFVIKNGDQKENLVGEGSKKVASKDPITVTCSVEINMNGNKVTNVAPPEELKPKDSETDPKGRSGEAPGNGADTDSETEKVSDDAMRLADTKNLLLRPDLSSSIQCLMVKGGTMQGNIDMGNHIIIDVDDYYQSGDNTAIASGAALMSAVMDSAGSWIFARDQLKELENGGLDELKKDLGITNGSWTPNSTSKILLKDGSNSMTGDLVFLDQDLVGGTIEEPGSGAEGEGGEPGDGGTEAENGESDGAEGGTRTRRNVVRAGEDGTGGTGETGGGSQEEEEKPTAPTRHPTITNLKDPDQGTDLLTRKSVDTVKDKLLLDGGEVLGDIDANHYSITGLKLHDTLITPDSEEVKEKAFAAYLEKLEKNGEVKEEEVPKTLAESAQLDEGDLVCVSDVINSFDHKYILEYLCYGLNVKQKGPSTLANIGWGNGSDKIQSKNASSYWDNSSGALKIKKPGVYLLTLILSADSGLRATSSLLTLKLKGIPGTGRQGTDRNIASFYLSDKGSASVTALIYVEPGYLGIPARAGSEVSVTLEIEGSATVNNLAWQISFIEDVSEDSEPSVGAAA